MSEQAETGQRPLTLEVDGRTVPSTRGTSVAVACLAAADGPAVFCGMGSCYGCVMCVDGVALRTCITPVEDGMHVTTITGMAPSPEEGQ